jgi:hypothetical protein
MFFPYLLEVLFVVEEITHFKVQLSLFANHSKIIYSKI